MFKLRGVAFKENECEAKEDSGKYLVFFLLTLRCPVHCGYVFVCKYENSYALIMTYNAYCKNIKIPQMK
jgi:hypothetical protein